MSIWGRCDSRGCRGRPPPGRFDRLVDAHAVDAGIAAMARRCRCRARRRSARSGRPPSGCSPGTSRRVQSALRLRRMRRCPVILSTRFVLVVHRAAPSFLIVREGGLSRAFRGLKTRSPAFWPRHFFRPSSTSRRIPVLRAGGSQTPGLSCRACFMILFTCPNRSLTEVLFAWFLRLVGASCFWFALSYWAMLIGFSHTWRGPF